MNILLNQNKSLSLVSLFKLEGITPYDTFKTVKYIGIDKFFDTHLLPESQRAEFLQYILDDIPWIRQERKRQTIIITLQKYASKAIICVIECRKTEYFKTQNQKRDRCVCVTSVFQSNSENENHGNSSMRVYAYHGDKFMYNYTELKVVCIKKFSFVDTFDGFYDDHDLASMHHGVILKGSDDSGPEFLDQKII